jgi:hypothetical protein
MSYGNPAITTPTANPTGVWSNGYVGVWHLKETSAPIKNYIYPAELSILGPESRMQPKLERLLKELVISVRRISENYQKNIPVTGKPVNRK